MFRFLFVGLSILAHDVVGPADVLDEASLSALKVRSIQFQMEVSLYPGVTQSFAAMDGMTRFDSTLPVAGDNNTGTIARGYAFNGEHYQQLEKGQNTIGISRRREPGASMCGPCWTPIEECYRWLRVAQHGFEWQTIRDPAVWSELHAEESISEVKHGEYLCKRIAIIFSKTSMRFEIDFCESLGHFPVFYQILDKEGRVVEFVSASDFIQAIPDNSLWIPTKVISMSVGDGGAVGKQEVTYNVLPNSIKVNHDIEPKFFTYDTKGLNSIIDADSMEILNLKTGKRLPIIPDPTDPSYQIEGSVSHGSKSPWFRWIFVLANLAILAVVSYLGTIKARPNSNDKASKP